MKRSILRSTLLATLALACPQAANAMLLVGFYDGATPSNADAFASGFTGSWSGVSTLAGSSWNSEDGTYGPDTAPGLSGAIGTPANGSFGWGGSGTRSISMTVTNNSGTAYGLDRLLFDFTNDISYPTAISVKYSLDGGPQTPLIASTSSVGGNSGSSAANNWMDVASGLIGVVLLDTKSITFTFDTTNGGGIDNIALTAIPEPGSLLAFGCFLGSGLLIRRNRRTTI